MPCESINAVRLAASLFTVIGEYFHVPAVRAWLPQQRPDVIPRFRSTRHAEKARRPRAPTPRYVTEPGRKDRARIPGSHMRCHRRFPSARGFPTGRRVCGGIDGDTRSAVTRSCARSKPPCLVGRACGKLRAKSRMARIWMLIVSSVVLALGGTYVLIAGVFGLQSPAHNRWGGNSPVHLPGPHGGRAFETPFPHLAHLNGLEGGASATPGNRHPYGLSRREAAGRCRGGAINHPGGARRRCLDRADS